MPGEEPDQAADRPAGEGACRHEQKKGERQGSAGIEEALQGQHGLHLPSRHADGLEHGQLPAPCRNPGENGVEKIQHANQCHDEAQRSAQKQEHVPEAVKLRRIDALAFIVQPGGRIFRVILQEGFHGSVRRLIRHVEGVVHHAVRTRIPDEGLRVQHKLIATIITVAKRRRNRHQSRHRIRCIPVFHRAAGIDGIFRHVLQGAVNLAGIRIIVFIFLHIPKGHGVPQSGPVTVHDGVSIIVFAVYGGNIISARFIERGQIPFQHGQMIQGKGLHAVELGVVRDPSVLRFLREAHQIIQILRRTPPAVCGAKVRFADKLLNGGGSSIDPAPVLDPALSQDRVHSRFGQGHILVEYLSCRLKLARVRQNEIARRKFGDILIHVKAVHEDHRHGKQHYRQRQGQNGHRRFPPAAAQIGPGHGKQGNPFSVPAAAFFSVRQVRGLLSSLPAAARLSPFPVKRHALRIAHGLHRGYPSRHPARPVAGNQHGKQGEDARARKNQRIHRNQRDHAVQLLHDHGDEGSAQKPAQKKAQRNAAQGKRQRLEAHDPPQLSRRGSDGF